MIVPKKNTTSPMGVVNTPRTYEAFGVLVETKDDLVSAEAAEGPDSIDHGSLGGLLDDDHPQYHNDARALIWLNANYQNTDFFRYMFMMGC